LFCSHDQRHLIYSSWSSDSKWTVVYVGVRGWEGVGVPNLRQKWKENSALPTQESGHFVGKSISLVLPGLYQLLNAQVSTIPL
jgi:hypothetical protein